ncbi:MAG: PAS domain-containing sensor histidine kinase [Cytophagales bacterium]|nr:PAS domain-containing sensor histidine kinase [Cytophagales bacterium]
MNQDVPADSSSHLKQTQEGAYSHRLSDAGVGGTHQRFRLGPDFFRQVVESLEDYAVFTTNVEGEVSSWNGAAERLLGYPEGEVIGRPAARLYTAQDQQQGIPGQQLHAARENAQVLVEREYPRNDGSLFWAAGKVFPLLDEESSLRGFTVILRDVTPARTVRMALAEHELELQRLNQELAAANEELAASNEELATTNEELTAAGEEVSATNEELTSTNAVLAHLNGDLENFVYAASHDLKAPILNIEGLLQVLLKKLPTECLQPEPVREILDLIDNSVERFKKTIESLLEIARLQQESDQPVTEVDLHGVVREVELDLFQLITGAGAQVEVDAEACPAIRFAQKHLRSVVYNFISNAIKYASPGRPPRVQVRCYREEKYTVLSVEDNGLGMDLGKDQKLFSLFHRLHDHVEGSGIGLYMVKKILENAGGKVEVESRLGEGSTFRAYFRA